MKEINKRMIRFASLMSGRTVRVLFMVLTLALFILSAAAPNATIGIGK